MPAMPRALSTTSSIQFWVKRVVLRVRLLAIMPACSRLRRSPDGVWCVDQALGAWSTHHTQFLRGEAAQAPGEDSEHQTRSYLVKARDHKDQTYFDSIARATISEMSSI